MLRRSLAMISFRSSVRALLGVLAFQLGCSSERVVPIGDPAGNAYLSRGRELVQGVAACGFCHGSASEPEAPLAGGLMQVDRYGEVPSANITVAASGIRDWSTRELMDAIRFSVGQDDRMLSLEVHQGFEWLSDFDTLSTIAFIRAQVPVENQIERRELGTIQKNTTGFWDSRRKLTGYVPEIKRSGSLEYGKYLTEHVARCVMCHNGSEGFFSDGEYLAGGKTIVTTDGEKTAPSVRSTEGSAVATWTIEDLVSFLRSGKTPQGRAVDKRFCPVNYYRNASDTDLQAISKYVKSIQETS